MALKIYNTITRTKEDFLPLNPPYVGMYVCGPTVYANCHIGHGRTYTVFDMIYRYLKYSGYNVRYIQNITDVGHLLGDSDEGEDKILKQARLEKQEPVAIAYKYEVSYFEDMEKLNILKPDISCRATGHILEMIEFIKELIAHKNAYVTEEGNVYFNVRSFTNYGKLSGRKLDGLKESSRIKAAADKINPQDFALWKAASDQHIMQWDSPWGKGYPGWHIECSVMSSKYIGDTLDIHGGGMDNLFPHHECEIAQSEALTGKPFVRYFIHNNMLRIDGNKMGKSLNNFIVLKDLFKQIDPMVLRFYILQCHYRSPLDFTQEGLKAAETGYERMKNSIFTLQRAVAGKKLSQQNQYAEINQLQSEIIEAMDDDFNTPSAIARLYDLLKLSNLEINQNKPDYNKLIVINQMVQMFSEQVLGFKLESNADGKHENSENQLIEYLIEMRNQFRADKNYQMSDQIRDKLADMNIILKDGVNGTTYTK